MGTKKSMGLSLIIFIFLIISCDKNQNIATFNFTIYNDTGVNIVLKPSSSKSEEIIINTGNFYNQKIEVAERFNNSREFNNFKNSIFKTSERLVVVFDGDRKLVFECQGFDDNGLGCNEPDNILTTIAPENSLEVTYTFTTDDFNNAIPCNGNCD